MVDGCYFEFKQVSFGLTDPRDAVPHVHRVVYTDVDR